MAHLGLVPAMPSLPLYPATEEEVVVQQAAIGSPSANMHMLRRASAVVSNCPAQHAATEPLSAPCTNPCTVQMQHRRKLAVTTKEVR